MRTYILKKFEMNPVHMIVKNGEADVFLAHNPDNVRHIKKGDIFIIHRGVDVTYTSQIPKFTQKQLRKLTSKC